MRIAFVLPNLSGGGAARVASILSNTWVQMGHQVHMITFEEPGTEGVYDVDPQVIRNQIGGAVSSFGFIGQLDTNMRRITRLRRVYQQFRPTVVLTFLLVADVAAIVAARGLAIPVVVGERNHPAHNRASRFRSYLRRITYPLANRIVVQNDDIAEWYARQLGLKATVIPNPVEVQYCGRDVPSGETLPSPGRKWMISLGRLEYQKGFDRLIEAFALLASGNPEWDLTLFGEGNERQSLLRLIKEHNLQGRVQLAGITKCPRAMLRRCDLYVHPARFEGYPNAVIEALAEGACVAAVDSPGATREILANGRHGFLLPDAGVADLAASLSRVLEDETGRLEFSSRAKEAVAHLTPHEVAKLWLKSFQNIC